MKANKKVSLLKKYQVKLGVDVYKEIEEQIVELLKEEFNLFLIGKALNDPGSMRAKLYKGIEKSEKNKRVRIYMPEFMFEELLFIPNYNLLDLENILADSVDAIVMCIESAGSFTELGAFVNHSKLNSKLIIILDKKYEKHKSFINLGPIKYLKTHTNSKVITTDYEQPISDSVMKELSKALLNIKKENTVKNYSLTNPIFAERFLLAILYTHGEISRRILIEIIKQINNKNKEEIIAILDASLATLLHHKEVKFDSDYYSLSNKGIFRLESEYPPYIIHGKLDKFRINMLNLKLRKLWA
jgi:hypothetical protein